MPKLPTVIVFCCREWVAPIGYPPGNCGLCGERPVYLRPDPHSVGYDLEQPVF